MNVRLRHVLHQGPVLAALGRSIAAGVRPRRDRALTVPGPWLKRTLPPRPPGLVADYLRHLGVDPADYRDTVPPHLFPQWVFPLQAEALRGVPYPLHKVLNGGCRLEVRGPLPLEEPLVVEARLDNIDDDGRRAVLRLVARTGTRADPARIEATQYAVVPLRRRPSDGKAKEAARAAADATELERWSLDRRAGLDFAVLTGDFNPVHWVRPYARAFGFRDVILHGFATFARSWEGLRRHHGALRVLDARFTRPLVLPADVGLFAHGSSVWVAPAPGDLAYLEGTYET